MAQCITLQCLLVDRWQFLNALTRLVMAFAPLGVVQKVETTANDSYRLQPCFQLFRDCLTIMLFWTALADGVTGFQALAYRF